MSTGDQPTVHPLAGNQALAVDPRDSVWLSASAGTGKTQVLSARVLRLLLEPSVQPEQILCLTFTKAGATEMAARINETLARWVRAEPTRLALELAAIGADIGPETQARARTLFAAVLDAPGGGLRIDTIHAFSQWLLAAFPGEAGLLAGARPMEDREKALLSRQVLADLLLYAEARGDAALLDALADLSIRLGEEASLGWLSACAAARDLWFERSDWNAGPLTMPVRRLLGLPAHADATWVAALCSDDAFDTRSLRAAMQANQQWKAKTGEDNANRIGNWLAVSPKGRLALLDDLRDVFFTKTGGPRASASLEKIDPGYPGHVVRLGEGIERARAAARLLALSAWLAPALELGRAYALAWDEAKAREGLIDFDDQIRRAADLLARSDMAEWIRYKLDRRFEHILVDEAQDTNAAQWRIIKALTDDFYAGLGAHGDRSRTLFVVGDYKQAIFGFQGTSPENFESARGQFRERIAGAADNALALKGRAPVAARALVELGLDRSFRTAAPVLDFVDRAIVHIGPARFGLADAPERHVGQARPGHVCLWRPVGLPADADEDEDADPGEGDPGQEAWLSRPDRDLADRLARQIKRWMVDGFPLVKGCKQGEPPRRAGPGDVMILVRKRRDLAGLIVARLHAAGVAVAGVDRLRLGAPLAVKDLVAALRFAAQPLDDLTLASLLVSPLIGWSQAQLLEHGWRTRDERSAGLTLWEHLRRARHPDVAAAMALLTDLLARADFEPVQALLHWLLVGSWRARQRLVARLGREANDPIDELLNAAQAYAASATPSLAGFLAWFDSTDGDLKREAGAAGDQVRVMTVHGSKGLQAPIVILADATGDPSGRAGGLTLADPASTVGAGLDTEPRLVPLPALKKDERLGRIAEAAGEVARAEDEEYWRLLYVAMTRAEEALFIGGALGSREKAPAPGSWYARLAELLPAEGWLEDDLWGARAEEGGLPPLPPAPLRPAELPLSSALPGWLTRPPAAEPTPARPLVPSALGEDLSPDPPYPPGVAGSREAARRGTLIHRLLERLPDVAPDAREQAAARWLARQAADLPEPARAEIAISALRVVADPRWGDLFSGDALAEAPIAALVGARVVTGTIDRLLIRPECIRLIDFKTARRPPTTLAEVPAAILRQMAAYAAALAVTWLDRRIEAALLYTQTPLLIEIPPDVLEQHKRSLLVAQESLAF